MGALLGETEPYLDTETCGRPRVGICYKGLIQCSFKISLHREFLIYNVADIWPKLEVNISVCDCTQVIHFTLDSLVIAD